MMALWLVDVNSTGNECEAQILTHIFFHTYGKSALGLFFLAPNLLQLLLLEREEAGGGGSLRAVVEDNLFLPKIPHCVEQNVVAEPDSPVFVVPGLCLLDQYCVWPGLSLTLFVGP